jgi:hypothetical protein
MQEALFYPPSTPHNTPFFTDTAAKFTPFVSDIVNAKRVGWSFKTLKLEELLKTSGLVLDDGSSATTMSEVERAVLSQSMRVVFLTMEVVHDTKLAKGDSIPKPNIPGAY